MCVHAAFYGVINDNKTIINSCACGRLMLQHTKWWRQNHRKKRSSSLSEGASSI